MKKPAGADAAGGLVRGHVGGYRRRRSISTLDSATPAVANRKATVEGLGAADATIDFVVYAIRMMKRPGARPCHRTVTLPSGAWRNVAFTVPQLRS
jgi:hypothetical protein